MGLTVLDNPLVAQKVTQIRNRETHPLEYTQLIEDVTTCLLFELARSFRTRRVEVTTPRGHASLQPMLEDRRMLIIPCFRAGVAMCYGVRRHVVNASIFHMVFVGKGKDRAGHVICPEFPERLAGERLLIVDPVIGTGQTITAALRYLEARGGRVEDCAVLAIAAARVGLETLFTRFTRDLRVLVAAVDEEIDEQGYLIPGLGDVGSRVHGIE